MFDSNAVQFQMIPVQDWYEKSGMLETAQTYGFTITEALFDDWIERGLLRPGTPSMAWPWTGFSCGMAIRAIHAVSRTLERASTA